MKKILFPAVAIVAMLMASCNGEPSNPEQNGFVPVLAQKLLDKNITEADKYLVDKEFVKIGDTDDNSIGSYVWPSSIVNEDGKVTKKDDDINIIYLEGYLKKDVVSEVYVEQELSNNKLKDMVTAYSSETGSLFSNVAMWSASIYNSDTNEESSYAGGYLSDEIMEIAKAAMQEQMDKIKEEYKKLLDANQITQEQYDELIKQLESEGLFADIKTQKDFKADLKNVDFSKNISISEVYVTLDEKTTIEALTAKMRDPNAEVNGQVAYYFTAQGGIVYNTTKGNVAEYVNLSDLRSVNKKIRAKK